MKLNDILQRSLKILQLPYIYCMGYYRYYKKKNHLRKSGYIVDPPVEFYFFPERYSVLKRNKWLPITYTKYGTSHTYEKIINGIK